jgi:hypothetical protein
MRRKLRWLLPVVLLAFPGCLLTPFAPFAEDVDGMDLSACLESSSGRETCWQLFQDNTEMFGGESAMDVLFNALF